MNTNKDEKITLDNITVSKNENHIELSGNIDDIKQIAAKLPRGHVSYTNATAVEISIEALKKAQMAIELQEVTNTRLTNMINHMKKIYIHLNDLDLMINEHNSIENVLAKIHNSYDHINAMSQEFEYNNNYSRILKEIRNDARTFRDKIFTQIRSIQNTEDDIIKSEKTARLFSPLDYNTQDEKIYSLGHFLRDQTHALNKHFITLSSKIGKTQFADLFALTEVPKAFAEAESQIYLQNQPAYTKHINPHLIRYPNEDDNTFLCDDSDAKNRDTDVSRISDSQNPQPPKNGAKPTLLLDSYITSKDIRSVNKLLHYCTGKKIKTSNKNFYSFRLPENILNAWYLQLSGNFNVALDPVNIGKRGNKCFGKFLFFLLISPLMTIPVALTAIKAAAHLFVVSPILLAADAISLLVRAPLYLAGYKQPRTLLNSYYTPVRSYLAIEKRS